MFDRFLEWFDKQPDNSPAAMLVALLCIGACIGVFLLFFWLLLSGHYVLGFLVGIAPTLLILRLTNRK